MSDAPFARRILDTVEDGFVFVDEQLRAVYSNPPAAPLLARADEAFQTACRRALAEGRPVQVERGGIELRVTPAEGGLIVRLREAAMRKATVGRARQARDAGAWDWDLETGAAWWSPEMYEMWGVEAGTQMNTAAAMESVDPADRERVAAAIDQCISSRTAAQWEFRIRHPRLGERSIASFARAVYDRSGRALRMLGISVDTTDRSRAEEQLREQREWLRVTLSSIGDAVITADVGGRVTFLNDVATVLTGWPREEAEGQASHIVLRMIDGRTRMPAEDLVSRVLKEGRVIDFADRTTLLTRDGREIPIEDSAAPIRNAAGEISGVVFVFRDVTAQRRAREAVRRSEELARQRLAEIEDLYRNAPIGLCVLDRDLRFVRVNRRLAEMDGASAAKHIGKTLREVVPGMADKAEAAMRRVVETGEPLVSVELHGETPAQPGVARTWVAHLLPVKDAAGSTVKLNVVVEEMTEAKQTEHELREALAEAEEAQRLLYALMENVPQGITIADAPDLRVRVVSREGERMLGGPHAGRTARELMSRFPLYRADGTLLSVEELPLARAIATGELVRNEEYVYEDPDGQRFTVLGNAAPIRDRHGNITAGIATWTSPDASVPGRP